MLIAFALCTQSGVGYASHVPQKEKAKTEVGVEKQATEISAVTVVECQSCVASVGDDKETPKEEFSVQTGANSFYPVNKLQFTEASRQRLNDLPKGSELYAVTNYFNSYDHDYLRQYSQPTVNTLPYRSQRK